MKLQMDGGNNGKRNGWGIKVFKPDDFFSCQYYHDSKHDDMLFSFHSIMEWHISYKIWCLENWFFIHQNFFLLFLMISREDLRNRLF